jgi:hypothetical protein
MQKTVSDISEVDLVAMHPTGFMISLLAFPKKFHGLVVTTEPQVVYRHVTEI